MNQEKVKLDNARHPEQRRKMEELIRSGVCHFRRTGFEKRHAAPIIYESSDWFIAANNYEYKGSVHHFLIVSKRHVRKVSELSLKAQIDLFKAIKWLEKHLNVPGYSIVVRSGNMAYTAATLDHLHFHFVVGGKKIGKGPNKLKNLIVAVVGFKKKGKK